jgi:hypothetical protein
MHPIKTAVSAVLSTNSCSKCIPKGQAILKRDTSE